MKLNSENVNFIYNTNFYEEKVSSHTPLMATLFSGPESVGITRFDCIIKASFFKKDKTSKRYNVTNYKISAQSYFVIRLQRSALLSQ